MRRALYGFAILAVLGIAGVWLAFNSLDVIVKWGIEHYGPDVAGVPVRVGAVAISPRDGRGSVRGLEIGSPGGYSAPRAVRVDEIRVALDPATLTSAVIHVQELVFEGAEITYERGNRSTNLDAIQQRIDAYAKRSMATVDTQKASGSPGHKRRFIVDRLVIRGAHATLTSTALRGQGIGFDLPEVDLADIGTREGGVTASEVASRVASAVQNRIAQKLLTNAELLRHGGVGGAIDALKGLLK